MSDRSSLSIWELTLPCRCHRNDSASQRNPSFHHSRILRGLGNPGKSFSLYWFRSSRFSGHGVWKCSFLRGRGNRTHLLCFELIYDDMYWNIELREHISCLEDTYLISFQIPNATILQIFFNGNYNGDFRGTLGAGLYTAQTTKRNTHAWQSCTQ